MRSADVYKPDRVARPNSVTAQLQNKNNKPIVPIQEPQISDQSEIDIIDYKKKYEELMEKFIKINELLEKITE